MNINCGGKINNNINIYAHILRQDNNNVYIKGNCEKSLFSYIKDYCNKYSSLSKKKCN